MMDFADRWPAMVVKELRQGLRARGFVIPFLMLHVLALGAVAVEYLLMRSGAAGSGWRGTFIEGPGLFWVAVYGIVAGVMPLRLMESLRGESDGRNAELLLLGGLTRWQIVRGKWLVQAVLTWLSLLSLPNVTPMSLPAPFARCHLYARRGARPSGKKPVYGLYSGCWAWFC